MFLRILKKDLKRKKTINIILLLFMILSSMFVASGLNNVITVMNGTDYYLDKAGLGDFMLVTSGDQSTGEMVKVLEKEPAVKDYRIERVVFGDENKLLLEDGGTVKTKNSILLFQALEDARLAFFDMDNNQIEQVAPGKVYVTGSFMKENGLEAGDVLHIKHGTAELDVVLMGKAKDALLGSDFLGNTRLLMDGADMRKLLADEDVRLHYQGEIGYIDTDDVSAMSSMLAGIPNVIFSGGRSMIKLAYVMDMIVAFIILILSICMMIVSFVVLKFSISFTIEEDFREIGVMKAIGLPNRKIRSLYIVKYLCAAVVGAAVGLAASIPFGELLLRSVSENMVLGNDMGIAVNAAGAALVVFIIVLFAYLCTGRVKKASPIDAIHSGQTGERYRKKTFYRLGKSHVGASFYMAVNDVVSSPRRFLTVIISFFICTMFVLILVNTTATMKSSNLVTSFGTKSDLYLGVETIDQMGVISREQMEEMLVQKGEELAEAGMPAELSAEIHYSFIVSFEGKNYSVTCQQWLGRQGDDFEYTEGSAPQNENEIAVTPQISKMMGAKIGDTVTVDFGEQKLDCVVTGYFETMNQLGQLIRLYGDAPADMKYVSAIVCEQIYFTDSPSAAEIEERKDRIKKLYDTDAVMNAAEYCAKNVVVADTMEAVQYLLLTITLLVELLVTILVERSFIADEKGQIAILKAIGFNDRNVICWHVCRFGLVAFTAVLLAALASIPMTDLCISPIFGMMGCRNIRYKIDILQVFILYPGIVWGMTCVSAWLTAQYTKKITSRDTSSIE